MALKKGVCKNYGNCPLADNEEIQEVDSSEFFCKYDGKPLYEITPPPPPPKWIYFVIAAIILIGGGIGVYFGFFRNTTPNYHVSLSIDKEEIILDTGNCKTLNVTVNTIPNDTGANVCVFFSSENANVAQVDNDGVVKAVTEGETTITVIAQSHNGAADTAYVKVTVKDKSDTQRMTISLNKEIIDFNVGDCDTLVVDVTANPPDANVSVSFTSDNANVAQVDNMGIVKAMAKGETTVTVVAWSPNGVADTAKVKVSVAEIVTEPKIPSHTKTRYTKKYSFGKYEGEMKNGIPEGDGKMYYYRHTQIAKHDTGNPPHYAESGDWFYGSWGNGDIICGALYNKDGRIKEEIFAPKRPNPYKLQ